MCKGRTRSRELEAAWRDRVVSQARSGLTVREFCRREELRPSAFYYWKRELARRDGQRQTSARKQTGRKPSPFLPIAVAPASSAPIEIALPGDVLIRVSGDCQASLLRMVVRTLEER